VNKEIWKNIPNYEKFYSASTFGNIKRLIGFGCKKEHLLKSKIDGGGRLFVCLSKNNIQKYFRVHQLILKTFVGECPKGMESCHNNGNEFDNNISNLRYGTHQSNINDKIKQGTVRKGSQIKQAKLNELQVTEIKKLLKENKLTQREISKMYNISFQTISLIKLNKTWKHIA